MSLSEIVDAEYRLQPADLPVRPSRVVIANVTYQGVEQLAPVLHFEGMTKRLVLSPDLVQRVVNLTGTPIFSRWIGITLILEVSRIDGAHMINIVAAENSPYAANAVVDDMDDAGHWRTALVTVGTIAILGLMFALYRLSYLEGILARLFSN